MPRPNRPGPLPFTEDDREVGVTWATGHKPSVHCHCENDTQSLGGRPLGQPAVCSNLSGCCNRKCGSNNASTLCFRQFAAEKLSTGSSYNSISREPAFTTSYQGLCPVSLVLWFIRCTISHTIQIPRMDTKVRFNHRSQVWSYQRCHFEQLQGCARVSIIS